jgi:rRNA maturation endonuclease Nob1
METEQIDIQECEQEEVSRIFSDAEYRRCNVCGNAERSNKKMCSICGGITYVVD